MLYYYLRLKNEIDVKNTLFSRYLRRSAVKSLSAANGDFTTYLCLRISGRMEIFMKDNRLEFHKNQFSYYTDVTLAPSPHLHREVELIYIEEGSTVAFADQKYTNLKKGDYFISFPNQIHYYRNTANGIYHIIIFSPDIIFGLRHIFIDQYPKNYDTKSNFSKLLYEFFFNLRTSNVKYKETFQIGQLNQIMSILLGNLELEWRTETDNITLSNLLNFCEKNFSENLSLDILSENFHMNKFHISHLFNQKLGVGFSYYINTLRIKEACYLISETKKSISDISETVGFCSIRSFNRAFSEIMNTTPLKYRALIGSTKNKSENQ